MTAKVAAFLEEQPNEAIRKLRYDQKPYWDVERARIGNSRKVPVEVVVNGRAVDRKEIDADGQLRDVLSTFRSRKAVGSACASCRHRTRTRYGSPSTRKKCAHPSAARNGFVKPWTYASSRKWAASDRQSRAK